MECALIVTVALLALFCPTSEASPTHQRSEDTYYELARQARQQLGSAEHSPSKRSAQFEALVRQGHEHNGYSAAEIKVALQASCIRNPQICSGAC